MSDDLWQSELAQMNQDEQEEERRRLDERWDRLSRGELSSEEDAELRALAETSEEAHAAYEAFRPLGPEFHASVVQAIRKQGPAPAARSEPAERSAKLLPFRQRSLARWGAAAALAAAASLVLLLRPPAPLPDYSPPEVSGGVSAWRGEETAEAPVLAPGGRFQVIVRPQTAVPRASRLEALCFVVRDLEVRPLEVRSEIDSSGAVKMEGSVSLDLQPGAWTLWSVVGRRGELPSPADLKSLSPGARVRQRDWVAVPANVRIRHREPSP